MSKAHKMIPDLLVIQFVFNQDFEKNYLQGPTFKMIPLKYDLTKKLKNGGFICNTLISIKENEFKVQSDMMY